MADTELVDGDYVLTEGRAWFTVGKFAVRIAQTDGGLACDVYENNKEAESPIASCYAEPTDA